MRKQDLYFEYYLWMNDLQKDFILNNNYGIEINDFYENKKYYKNYNLDWEISEYKTKYNNKINKSFHGPYINLNLAFSDQDMAENSQYKIIKSLNIASEIGCNKIVFHTGYIPIRNSNNYDSFVERQINFWNKASNDFDNIEICIENVFENDYKIMKNIFDGIKTKNISMCFDIAHALVFGNGNFIEWIDNLKNKISHVHLSNNDLLSDSHKALCDGLINIPYCINYLNKTANNLTYAFEVCGFDNSIKSLDYLKNNGIEFA